MAICISCKGEYSDARLDLGLTVCPDCGDKAARETIEARKTQILPSHHKGGYTFVSESQQRELLLQASSRDPRKETVDATSKKVGRNIVARRTLEPIRQAERPKVVRWELIGWEFPVDKKTGIRTKRAILKRRGEE